MASTYSSIFTLVVVAVNTVYLLGLLSIQRASIDEMKDGDKFGELYGSYLFAFLIMNLLYCVAVLLSQIFIFWK